MSASILSLFLLSLVPVLFLWVRRGRNLRYPPGPKGWPLIGNTLDIPKHQPWLSYRQWSQRLGSDLLYLNAMGKDMIIVNSYEAARELFENKSAKYSDRPQFYALKHLLKANFVIFGMPYGSRWRVSRRSLHQYLDPSKYEHVLVDSVHNLLVSLLEDPASFTSHVRFMLPKMIMKVTYGIDVSSKNDPCLAISEKFMEGLIYVSQPYGLVLDRFPIRGMFIKKGRAYGQVAQEMLRVTLQATRTSLADGSPQQSVAASVIEDVNAGKYEGFRDVVETVPGSMFVAGVDTTVSTLLSFIRAMAMNPAVQQRAQKELDEAVGSNRLPTIEDQSSLPYVEAIVKEALRYEPVGPMGIAHSTSEADHYDGFFIPKGSVIMPNVWAMLHEPSVYPNPETFSPDRFLDPNLNCPDPEIAFGFGRRLCPGRALARQTLFLTIASILSLFNIKKCKDQDGKEIDPASGMTDGIGSYPIPYNVDIVPRNSGAVQLSESLRLQS